MACSEGVIPDSLGSGTAAGLVIPGAFFSATGFFSLASFFGSTGFGSAGLITAAVVVLAVVVFFFPVSNHRLAGSARRWQDNGCPSVTRFVSERIAVSTN